MRLSTLVPRRAIGRVLSKAGGLFSALHSIILISGYFRLRRDIYREMPWTCHNLHHLVTPYIPGERLPSNGYISAIIQVEGFCVIVHRQPQEGGNDDMFSVISPYSPEKPFPFMVTEAAVLKLEGLPALQAKSRYDNMRDVDRAMEKVSALFRKHLSYDSFSDTKVVIEAIWREGLERTMLASASLNSHAGGRSSAE